MFLDDIDDNDVAALVITAIASGCALIGLLANNHGAMGPTMDTYVDDAWKAGDLMCVEFMQRVKVMVEKNEKEKTDGGK